MEKECSVYKVTYKQLNNGLITDHSLEIIIYGENLEQIQDRLYETLSDLDVTNYNFKMYRIERK